MASETRPGCVSQTGWETIILDTPCRIVGRPSRPDGAAGKTLIFEV